jgi:hypothetical protein
MLPRVTGQAAAAIAGPTLGLDSTAIDVDFIRSDEEAGRPGRRGWIGQNG